MQSEKIPYHLVDIVEAGYEYNVYEFQKDFIPVYNDIKSRGKVPVLCGGSGLYLDSVLRAYKLIRVPKNDELRAELKDKDEEELIQILKSLKKLHNITDIVNRKRILRAIEIETYYKEHGDKLGDIPKYRNILFGVKFDRGTIRSRITDRLKQRLDEGLVEEVETLLSKGLTEEKLKYYGLEYKFVTQYINREINYNDMFQRLNTAIHQFAKRQMTWFRKMEREGLKIHWIDGYKLMNEKLEFILDKI